MPEPRPFAAFLDLRGRADVEGAALAIAATDDPAVNAAVARAARERGIGPIAERVLLEAELARSGSPDTP